MNLHDYESADLDAHKAMRTVVPEILVRYGMRPAVLNLFDDKPEVQINTSNRIQCIGYANVHYDAAKMEEYERRIAKPNQRFFTDVDVARQWLLTLV